MEINTGKFLNGNELIIRIDKLNKKVITLYIDIPENYNSNLTKYLSENGEPFFGYLHISWNKNNKGAFLHSFYIKSKDTDGIEKIISEEEVNSLKGLGKFMLCSAISIGLKKKYINMDTSIFLEADGGSCKDSSLFEKYDYNDFLNKYPNEISEIIKEYGVENLSDVPHSDLIFLICRIVANSKLVNYYNKSYGFEDISGGRGTGVLMKSNISNIYGSCKQLLHPSGL
jgi:hypothetical protein